jgi:TPR repeat protein
MLQFHVAQTLEFKLGVEIERSVTEAVRWYSLAAAAGHKQSS